MILFPMLILLVVPLVAGIESLFVKKENVRATAALAGVCVGAFVWNAYTYWPAFPLVSIGLLALAAALTFRLLFVGMEVLSRGLVVALVSAVALFLAWQGLLTALVNAEAVSGVEVVNPNGAAGTALVVYHPGRSGFQEHANRAFAEGLAAHGWRVEITTASREAPADLSDYDLLVLGAPTYDWKPAKPIQHYLKRLGNLGGQPTVVIISGAGYTRVSLPMMEQLVREADGRLVASYALWTSAPNIEMCSTGDVGEAMRREAKAIPLPGD